MMLLGCLVVASAAATALWNAAQLALGSTGRTGAGHSPDERAAALYLTRAITAAAAAALVLSLALVQARLQWLTVLFDAL